MLTDLRVIARHAETTVLEDSHVVTWPDGSSVRLHRVRLRDCDQTFLRALQVHDGHWLVFDLRSTARALDRDLREMLARDHDGVVLYTLRAAYSCAAEFEARAYQHPHAIWMGPDLQLKLDLPAMAPTAHLWTSSMVRAAA